MDILENAVKGEKLTNLLRVETEARQGELQRAQRSDDLRHCLMQWLGAVSERYVQALPIACEAPATTYLRLLELSAGYLDAASCVARTAPEQVGANATMPAQELSAARPVRLGALVVLLIALLALLSASWLASVAFALALLLFAIELIPYLLALRSEAARHFGRWQPWKAPIVESAFQGGQPPLPSAGDNAHSGVRVQWHSDKIVATLTAMAAVVDEGMATWMETLQRRPVHATPRRDGVDPELVILLQQLLRDSQQTDPRYMRERIQRIPDLLKAQGLRLLRYEDLPADVALDEYFQVFVDPSVASIVTVLPAVVAGDGVVAEGRLIVADYSVLTGG
ncbi:MAG TPA: hypothetical protein DCL15_19130 [Chloroflexi bacterium]|nr:hypothetical protein [Chloroflexota bacterium]HHW86807.1 hypothetical protein [Chloroflexota bacterium]